MHEKCIFYHGLCEVPMMKKNTHPTSNVQICFEGHRLRISSQIFIIQNGEFKMAIAETKKHDGIDKHIYSEVFGVTDNESVIRFSHFKMADLK